MKLASVFLISLCLAVCVSAQPPSGSVTVIKAGTLIDGKSDSAAHNKIIVVRGNRIESVSDANAAIPTGATVIDLSHATVLPGLIDSHTHIFLQGEAPAEGGYDVNILKYPLALRAARATVSARRALEQGFTTLRDVETEGAGYGDVGIKEAIEGGYIPPARASTSSHEPSRRLAAIPWMAMRPSFRCPKARRLPMVRSRCARPRANNSTMARTGSRFT
jgi:imidazolonepropionase-like amidohydrolase